MAFANSATAWQQYARKNRSMHNTNVDVLDMLELHKDGLPASVERQLVSRARRRWHNTPHKRLPWPSVLPDIEKVPISPRWENHAMQRLTWPARIADYAVGSPESLKVAIERGSVAEVEELMTWGDPCSAVFELIEKDNLQCTGNLLDLALLKQRYRLVLRLLAGRREDAKQLACSATCAVMLAARAGQPEVLKQLLELSANPIQCDGHGRSALSLAAWRGHGQCVHLLFDAGALQEDPDRDRVQEMLSRYTAKGDERAAGAAFQKSQTRHAKENCQWRVSHT
mmetsp:Transcript_127727/g.221408  ORF Transcript_127727/g.221408 Transcript_127727/m.221408 type:complete len:283 (+) Transcript_127727:92-940(+)